MSDLIRKLVSLEERIEDPETDVTMGLRLRRECLGDIKEIVKLSKGLTSNYQNVEKRKLAANRRIYCESGIDLAEEVADAQLEAGRREIDKEKVTSIFEEFESLKKFLEFMKSEVEKIDSEPGEKGNIEYKMRTSLRNMHARSVHLAEHMVNVHTRKLRSMARQYERIGMVLAADEVRDINDQSIKLGRAYSTLFEQHGSGAGITEEMRDDFWTELSRLGVQMDRFSVEQSQPHRLEHAPLFWQDVLNYVGSVEVISSKMREAVAHVLSVEGVRADREPETIAEGDDWNVVLPSAAAQTQPEPSSRRSRRRNREKAVAAMAGSLSISDTQAISIEQDATRASEEKDLREALFSRVNDALKTRRLTSTLAREANDFLALADSLGKDTTKVREMEAEVEASKVDPLWAANGLRMTRGDWFGYPAVVQRTYDALAVFGANHPGDEEVAARLAQLEDRIGALQAIDDRLQVKEADYLKGYQFPKGQHLKRLVELGQIESILPLRMLSASGSHSDKGTLFELEIAPRPRSDGTPANHLYLHLHTAKAVTVAECARLRFKDFAAAHVKHETQRNLGPAWEQLQREYGNIDVRVHRGPVDSELLDILLRDERASSAQALASSGTAAPVRRNRR
jgi:hypothetical protein